jgi:hypothetical protein
VTSAVFSEGLSRSVLVNTAIGYRAYLFLVHFSHHYKFD